MDSHMLMPSQPMFSQNIMLSSSAQFLFFASSYNNQLFHQFFQNFLSFEDFLRNNPKKVSAPLKKGDITMNQTNGEAAISTFSPNNEKNETKIDTQNLKENELPKQAKIDFIFKAATLCKRQAKLPHFEHLNNNVKKKYFQNNLLWDSQKITNSQFLKFKQEIEKLMNIRDVDEEELCKLIKENNYEFERTLKICRDKRMEILKKLISKKAKKGLPRRKTLNSLFH